MQAAEWRKNGNGKDRGRSSCVIEKKEACPAVLRKPSQQGEGEASRLWGQGKHRRNGLRKKVASRV